MYQNFLNFFISISFFAVLHGAFGQGPMVSDSASFAVGSKKERKADPFTFSSTVQGGLFQNFAGGKKTGSDYIGRVHLTLSLNTKKAGLWKNGTFLVNAVNAHGGSPTSTYIGDFQPISRNEASERTGLFELWYKHTMGQASILIGQHDMNSSFGTSGYAGNSIHSAFGMYPSITPNAGYSFSIYPRTMPAIYFRYDSLKTGRGFFTLQAAVYAGASENFDRDPHNLKMNLDESRYAVGEIHYNRMKNGLKRGTYKLGVGHHSGDFPSVVNDTGKVKGNLGIYLIADHMLLPEKPNSNQGLALFLQVGSAQGGQNLVDLYFSTGIYWMGLIPRRDRDALFLGFLNSTVNNDLVIDQSNVDPSRSVIELNYSMRFGSHFTLQPDLQYIINPGANAQLDDALLGILRFSVNF